MMFHFRNYALWCHSEKTYFAAEKKAFELGYGWGSPGNSVGNPEPFLAYERKKAEEFERYGRG